MCLHHIAPTAELGPEFMWQVYLGARGAATTLVADGSRSHTLGGYFLKLARQARARWVGGVQLQCSTSRPASIMKWFMTRDGVDRCRRGGGMVE